MFNIKSLKIDAVAPCPKCDRTVKVRPDQCHPGPRIGTFIEMPVCVPCNHTYKAMVTVTQQEQQKYTYKYIESETA